MAIQIKLRTLFLKEKERMKNKFITEIGNNKLTFRDLYSITVINNQSKQAKSQEVIAILLFLFYFICLNSRSKKRSDLLKFYARSIDKVGSRNWQKQPI